MNDEQQCMARFWALSAGTGPFFRISALRFAHLAVLNFAQQALACKKMASGDTDSVNANRP
jgi:hypothetical protein